MKTFPGGIHPPYLKTTKSLSIQKAKLPKQVVIPLSQHIGSFCEPAVSVGGTVKTGALIGKSDKFASCLVHSSVSGTVKTIERRLHPTLGVCNAVVIDSDGKDENAFTVKTNNIDKLTPEQIIDIVRQAGIAGLGGACFPTHIKLKPPEEKKIDTFILNGAECEPRLSCDHRLMLERADEIIKGAILMMKAVGVNKGIIAIEDNKPDAVESMKKALNSVERRAYSVEVITLKTKYPQGGEKQLIKALLNREVPPGDLPFDIGCIVDNVGTAASVYEAAQFSKPLYERVVTVCGDAIANEANLLVKIGTPLKDLIDSCGGLKKELGKIIFGGPMMGLCQFTDEVPVVKGTSGVIFVSREKISAPQQGHCIRCGKCIQSCPVNLIPTTIALASEKNRLDVAAEFNAADCIECGACAYVCPSKISLLHLIKQAKKGLLCQIVK
ncbi:MAG: electron transport complex subunit RsxC [Candidatus Omnitrophota bacterium]